jgi:hypothetical protein
MKCKSCHQEMTFVRAPRYSSVYGVLVLAIGVGVPLFLALRQPGFWYASAGLGALCVAAGAYLARASGEIILCGSCGGRERLDAEAEKAADQAEREKLKEELRAALEKELRPKLKKELRPSVEAMLRPEIARDVEDRLSRELRERITAELTPSIERRMRDDLEPRVRASLEPTLRRELEERLRPELEEQLRPELEASVRRELEPKLRRELEPTVRSELEPRLRSELEPKLRGELELLFNARRAAAPEVAAEAPELAPPPTTPLPEPEPIPPAVKLALASEPEVPSVQLAPVVVAPVEPRRESSGPVVSAKPAPESPSPATVMPPAKLAAVGMLTEPHQRAQRKARVIVSDVLLYDRALVEQAVRATDPFVSLDKVWREAQRTYNESVAAEIQANTHYLRDAFEDMFKRMRRELKIEA